jgi:hypothetical protein
VHRLILSLLYYCYRAVCQVYRIVLFVVNSGGYIAGLGCQSAEFSSAGTLLHNQWINQTESGTGYP